MELFLGIMFFILGTCVGSFINMLVYRTAVRYKLKNLKFKNLKNRNRSFCDWCGRQLKWYENIPIVSWVIQKGKTRCCGKKLPLEYPLVEIAMGIIFIFVETALMPSLQMAVMLVIATLLIFSTVFDLKYMILPDFSTYILILLTLIFNHDLNYLLSAVGAGGFLGGLYLVTKGKGMGLGDVKLALFMGLWLGFPKIIVAFYLAFIVGAIIGLGLIVFKIRKRNQPIPFGPFLILGLGITSIFGDKILYYFSRWL